MNIQNYNVAMRTSSLAFSSSKKYSSDLSSNENKQRNTSNKLTTALLGLAAMFTPVCAGNAQAKENDLPPIHHTQNNIYQWPEVEDYTPDREFSQHYRAVIVRDGENSVEYVDNLPKDEAEVSSLDEIDEESLFDDDNIRSSSNNEIPKNEVMDNPVLAKEFDYTLSEEEKEIVSKILSGNFFVSDINSNINFTRNVVKEIAKYNPEILGEQFIALYTTDEALNAIMEKKYNPFIEKKRPVREKYLFERKETSRKTCSYKYDIPSDLLDIQDSKPECCGSMTGLAVRNIGSGIELSDTNSQVGWSAELLAQARYTDLLNLNTCLFLSRLVEEENDGNLGKVIKKTPDDSDYDYFEFTISDLCRIHSIWVTPEDEVIVEFRKDDVIENTNDPMDFYKNVYHYKKMKFQLDENGDPLEDTLEYIKPEEKEESTEVEEENKRQRTLDFNKNEEIKEFD